MAELSMTYTPLWPLLRREEQLERPHWYVKEIVYVNKPQTLQELKENIRNEIREVNRNPEILQSVMNNDLERAQICEAENGQHLTDIIFHK